jgi:hypothetical protein
MAERPTEIDEHVRETKGLRWGLDVELQALRTMMCNRSSRERSLAITKIQEAIMWLGMDLKDLAGGKSCYVHGYDQASPVVDPPADGLKH